ncbi:MAG: alpha/beta hydrolase [Bryobacteraceae bacterium]|nr:alpha/beta hydrolase [Bryobacteraceae bacterium]
MLWYFLAAGLVFLFVAGLFWHAAEEAADARRFRAPGGMVSGLHVQEAGSDGPSVVIESGVAASSTGWALVIPRLASFCKVFAYDRPGYGWSAPSAVARTPDQYMAELDAVVRHAGAPAVLVGHSFGGLAVQLYAARFPEKVAALVLVDPAHMCEWANPTEAMRWKLDRGVRLSRRGAWLARTGFVRFALTLLSTGARGASKWFAHAASTRRGTGYLEKLVGEVRKLPPEVWPIVQSHWCRPSSFLSMSEQLASLPAMATAVAREPVPSSIAVTVLSGAHLTGELLAEHREIAARSVRGRHVVAEGSGHWVHLDRPDLVVEAVRDVIAQEG